MELMILSKPAQVQAQVLAWKRQGLTIGLVPTMGYLHEGHASLIRRAAAECDRVVVSVFVNPTQFGPNEDLESYPRDIDHDTALIKECGGNLVFAPQPADMYGEGTRTWVTVEGLTKELCGRSRPIHFLVWWIPDSAIHLNANSVSPSRIGIKLAAKEYVLPFVAVPTTKSNGICISPMFCSVWIFSLDKISSRTGR